MKIFVRTVKMRPFMVQVGFIVCLALASGCAAKRAYNKGILAAGEEQYAKAILHYRKAIEKDPNFVDAHYNMASCYAKLQLLDNAVRAYEKAIECRPDMYEAHWNLAVALTKMDRLEEANRAWQQALSLCKDQKESTTIRMHIRTNEKKMSEAQEPETPQEVP